MTACKRILMADDDKEVTGAPMKRILIVEDDPKVARVLHLRMRAEGHHAITACDAIQAIVWAKTTSPDLLLLDINLPGGSGIDVAKRLRRVLNEPIPIIFLTASKKPGLLREAMQVGDNVSFLEKPYRANDLIAATRRLLSIER